MKKLTMITRMWLAAIVLLSCGVVSVQGAPGVIVGAARTTSYLPLLKGKKVALFSNNSGRVNGKYTLDVMLAAKVNVVVIFSPEHGFRGTADAGEQVSSSVDTKTGVPIYSLYSGKNGVPDDAEMKKFDLLVVDIQDVGLRFYTYYISMVKLMDACAIHGKRMIILDRPNPNGFYVDGPILNMKYKSGVGYLPIPVVHGMTLGELARMVNGKHWLPGKRECALTVVRCQNYTHRTKYVLPVAPSPNLPNMKAVYLYPSLCYFEGTPLSVGRGTSLPFQQYGYPEMKGYTYTFTPASKPGAKNPPLLGKRCHGKNLSTLSNWTIWKNGLDLSYIVDAYKRTGLKEKFFTSFFEKLIGVDYVRKMIEEGKSAEEIKAKWQDDVQKFKKERKPYLLYSE
jgi:uncharacterized protein YbbC (DUF1343 family)